MIKCNRRVSPEPGRSGLKIRPSGAVVPQDEPGLPEGVVAARQHERHVKQLRAGLEFYRTLPSYPPGVAAEWPTPRKSTAMTVNFMSPKRLRLLLIPARFSLAPWSSGHRPGAALVAGASCGAATDKRIARRCRRSSSTRSGMCAVNGLIAAAFVASTCA
jgi:hypothetical protein